VDFLYSCHKILLYHSFCQQDSIKVSKLPSDVTEDALKLFFENRRKCGGGEIKKFTFFQEKGTGVAFITYRDQTGKVVFAFCVCAVYYQFSTITNKFAA